jgi:hypothetical protein
VRDLQWGVAETVGDAKKALAGSFSRRVVDLSERGGLKKELFGL